MSQTTISQGAINSTPYIISKSLFFTLGPLEQLAARALEQTGKVRIVEDTEIQRQGDTP
jgi:hypothetical protein